VRVLIAARAARAARWEGLAAGLESASVTCRVLSPTRSDRWPEHWHKSRSPEAAEAWRTALETERVSVAVVDGWRGMSDDLVRVAARAGVPCVLFLGEHDATCALGTRLRATDGAPCDAVEGFHPCLACAAEAPPRATWVPTEQRPLLLGRRRAALATELAAARVVAVPSEAHAVLLARHGASFATPPTVVEGAPGAVTPAVLEVWLGGLRTALARGVPSVPPEGWFEARLAAEELRAWDERARERP
jgi:hypothetical protein